MSGKKRRLARLFRHADGRAVLTPIDHGLWYGPMPGIESPVEIVRCVIPESDGLLLAPGFARAVSDVLPSDRALVLRVGASTSLSPSQDYESIFADVETALLLDADALVHTLYLGGSRDEQALRDLGQIIKEAERCAMPVLAEFLPPTGEPGVDQVAQWARLGFEMGADMIKTVYTGEPDAYRRVVAGCPLPILIAGGPAVGTPADLLRTVASALEAGAAGTAIGRRVWQSAQPRRLLKLFGQLMHGQINLEQALAAVDSWS
jgi:fructose-bisphosphate aldolase / 2-amino-3,7-dideoxy-D-threo-hept-6-ulosonate synthase